jgi:hypothetical protein
VTELTEHEKSNTLAPEGPVAAALRLTSRSNRMLVAVWPSDHVNGDGQPVAYAVVSDTGTRGPDADSTFAVHIMKRLEGGYSHLAHGDYGMSLSGATSLALLRAKEAR